MNTNIIVGVVALAVGLSVGYFLAGEHSVPEVHDMDSTMAGMTAGLADREGAEFERAFIDEMILHHEGAVVMARTVLEKTQRPELVQLANNIITAQTQEIQMMRAWRAEWFGE